MHKRGLCRHAVSVRQSVRLSVTFVDHVKTNKHIFEIFSLLGSQAILVFLRHTRWRYSDGNPHNGSVECRWVRQKTRFWMNIWLRCIQVYSVINCTSREVWKTKPRRTAASVEHTAASVVRCSHKTTTKCLWVVTGSTLYAGYYYYYYYYFWPSVIIIIIRRLIIIIIIIY